MFTKNIGGVKDLSGIIGSGGATDVLDKTFESGATAAVGIAGGALTLMQENRTENIATGLVEARNDAFNQFEKFVQKGSSVRKQGSAGAVRAYNLALKSNIASLEKEYPGSLLEISEKAKALGLTPRADILAEQKRLEENNEAVFKEGAVRAGAVVYPPNSDEPDWEATRVQFEKLNIARAETTRIHKLAKSKGMSDQNLKDHSPTFLENSHIVINGINAEASVLSGKLSLAIKGITQAGGKVGNQLAEAQGMLLDWKNKEIAKLNGVFYNKDREALVKVINDRVGSLQEYLSGGEGKTLGILQVAEVTEKLAKAAAEKGIRVNHPELYAITKLFTPELSRAFMSAQTVKMMSSIDNVDFGNKLTASLKTIMKNSVVENYGAGVWKGASNPELSAAINDGRGILKILSKGDVPPTSKNLITLYQSYAALAAAVGRGETLDRNDYKAIKSDFSNPNMKNFLEAMPEVQRKQLGSLGFQVLNNAVHEDLKVLGTTNGYTGLAYDGNKLTVTHNLSKEQLDVMSGLIGTNPAEMMQAQEGKINKSLDDIAYYSKFLGREGSATQRKQITAEAFIKRFTPQVIEEAKGSDITSLFRDGINSFVVKLNQVTKVSKDLPPVDNITLVSENLPAPLETEDSKFLTQIEKAITTPSPVKVNETMEDSEPIGDTTPSVGQGMEDSEPIGDTTVLPETMEDSEDLPPVPEKVSKEKVNQIKISISRLSNVTLKQLANNTVIEKDKKYTFIRNATPEMTKYVIGLAKAEIKRRGA